LGDANEESQNSRRDVLESRWPYVDAGGQQIPALKMIALGKYKQHVLNFGPQLIFNLEKHCYMSLLNLTGTLMAL
jgi:hypothetical protein